MTSYYIDPSGPNGSGSQGSPYNSFASVPSLVAGDNVFFKCGTTHTGQILYNSSRGASTTLASPITFGKYGTGANPIIASNDWCVDVDARNGVIVQDLQTQPVNSFSSGGVRILNSAQCTVQRMTTSARCDYGIRIDNTGASALGTINVLNNTILGTYGNTCILVVYGSSIGGVFEDVTISGNVLGNAGAYATDGTPYGIRTISRTTPVTTSSGTVDLDLFSRGVRINDNTITSNPAYGIAAAHISTGGTETLTNQICRNFLTDIGDGAHDSHMLWVAGCRNVDVVSNILDGSIMFQGSTFGTGVGIFVDAAGFGNEFDGARGIRVIRNLVQNTGQQSAGSAGTLEVAGAGLLAFLSQTVQFIDNETRNCHNGLGVLGWFGTGLKTQTVTARGNRLYNSTRAGISNIKASDAVTMQENFVDGYGTAGIYVENAGAYAVTSYTETRNGVSGLAATAYMGGSEPTSTETPSATRTPSAGNLVLSTQYY